MAYVQWHKNLCIGRSWFHVYYQPDRKYYKMIRHFHNSKIKLYYMGINLTYMPYVRKYKIGHKGKSIPTCCIRLLNIIKTSSVPGLIHKFTLHLKNYQSNSVDTLSVSDALNK